MKVYLAAPYATRNALRAYALDLSSLGHECTSTWLIDDHPITASSLGTSPGSSDEYATKHVSMDIDDVKRSDVLVLFTWSKAEDMVQHSMALGTNSGGRHVETGIALGAGIPVIVYGPPENIFHRTMTLAHDWADVLSILKK